MATLVRAAARRASAGSGAGSARLAGALSAFAAKAEPAAPAEAAEAPPSDLVEVFVDGRAVSVPKGASVLQACDALGVDVPRRGGEDCGVGAGGGGEGGRRGRRRGRAGRTARGGRMRTNFRVLQLYLAVGGCRRTPGAHYFGRGRGERASPAASAPSTGPPRRDTGRHAR